MTKTMLALAAFLAAGSPALARNFAAPLEDPAITLSVPNSWTVKEVNFGYSVLSPDKDVLIYLEYAAGSDVKTMTDVFKWMKANKIETVGAPTKLDADFNGIKGTITRYKAKDSTGPTNINFALIPTTNNRMIMITLWGSDEQQDANRQDIDAILASVRPIP